MHEPRPSRRSVLQRVSGCAVAGRLISAKPQIKAVDCHIHIYEPRFLFAANAVLKPPPATVADYHLLQKRLGTKCCVVVQPSSYGTDNRCLLDALSHFGPSEARGIAVVNPSVSDTELNEMNQAGVRGIRFNLLQAGATTLDMLEPLSKKVAALGWHVQVNASPERLVSAASILERLPCPVVFDHFGHTLSAGRQSPAFYVIMKLLKSGKGWLKMSGVYMDSKLGPPSYADSLPVARAYVDEVLSQLVWGSDWPHPTEKTKPDDTVLLNLLSSWVPDEASRNKILVDNPTRLYGF